MCHFVPCGICVTNVSTSHMCVSSLIMYLCESFVSPVSLRVIYFVCMCHLESYYISLSIICSKHFVLSHRYHCVSITCHCVSFMCHCVSITCHCVSFMCHCVSITCHCVSFMCHCVSFICHCVSFMCHCVSFTCHCV